MLKQFFSVMGRYLKPYRKYLAWSVVLNFLSQWMNVFSFAVLIPILNRMFSIGISTANENTFIHCDRKLRTTDQARYLRYGRR